MVAVAAEIVKFQRQNAHAAYSMKALVRSQLIFKPKRFEWSSKVRFV